MIGRVERTLLRRRYCGIFGLFQSLWAKMTTLRQFETLNGHGAQLPPRTLSETSCSCVPISRRRSNALSASAMARPVSRHATTPGHA